MMNHIKTNQSLTGERLVEQMSAAEKERANRIESLLPMIRSAAADVSKNGRLPTTHIDAIRQASLLGLVVPQQYGGLGGSLRDLAAATFALGTACPSTALAYFFHNSTVSRGLLALEAVEARLFEGEEAPIVHQFGEKVLTKMGERQLFLGNFASESAKSANSAVVISTEARPVAGGWRLSGEKSFGCNTGTADEYLVTAKIAGTSTAAGLGLFFVPRDAAGVSERPAWDAIGMRATASHGIHLKDVFVSAEESLTVPAAFVKMMQMSRGSLLGNQLAISAIYLGAAHQSFDFALDYTTQLKFKDSGKPIASSPFHQELIGKTMVNLQTAVLWLRRQLELETADPPLLPKSNVVQQWRLAKGVIAENAIEVAQNSLKMCGTSNTGNDGVLTRMIRDITMGLVMGFPAERGRLEAAKMAIAGSEQATFGV